jgi:hypothetical protein
MSGDVDAQLLHNRDRFRPDAAWLGSGAEDLEAVSGVVAQQTLGHLAPG